MLTVLSMGQLKGRKAIIVVVIRDSKNTLKGFSNFLQLLRIPQRVVIKMAVIMGIPPKLYNFSIMKTFVEGIIL